MSKKIDKNKKNIPLATTIKVLEAAMSTLASKHKLSLNEIQELNDTILDFLFVNSNLIYEEGSIFRPRMYYGHRDNE